MGRVALIGSVIARMSVPGLLLGAPFPMGDIAWLILSCLCYVVCGCGQLHAFTVVE